VRYPNFRNANTRPVGPAELRWLFPGARMRLTAVTLLPPLARRLGPLTASAYGPLHAVRPLRSHYLAEIRLPGRSSGQLPSAGSPDG
jgi:hypothetical protein